MTAPGPESRGLLTPERWRAARARDYVDATIQKVLGAFPDPAQLAAEERRGLIARYSTVLEGNFIAWMTATHLAVASDTARAIIEDNLREEVRDNHPGMLRRFTIAARAVPTDADVFAVGRQVQEVRQFLARLSGPHSVLMMAFFEGFIQRFMAYLAELARRQGSAEQEYTEVHGIVDVEHTEGLFRALEAELALTPDAPPDALSLIEGVEVLRALIESIAHPSLDDAAVDEKLAMGIAG